MKNIIIRKSVPKYVLKKLEDILLEGLLFMEDAYPEVSFNQVRVIVTYNASRSRYYRNDYDEHLSPTVLLNIRDNIFIYNMKSLKIKSTFAKAPFFVSGISSLIHELTHHVQYEKGLPKGELLTTKNELEYLKVFHPDIHKQLI